MDNNKKRPEDQNEEQSQGAKKSSSGSGNAANLDAIISNPTDAARSHRHTDTWSNQGTNTSYEGATAPAGGGSVGTGYASGKDAVGARISANDNDDHARPGKKDNEGEQLMKPEEHDDELDRDTMGTP